MTIKWKIERLVGWVLYKLGRAPTRSTSVADTPTAGYGELDFNGFWKYPVPSAYWRKRFGVVIE